ncbi:Chaperone DnaJ-domain superfamily protein [Raphanus sativus]|nr:Chaperone DnaJ-domain superfamily protein [Raphanus sativus]
MTSNKSNNDDLYAVLGLNKECTTTEVRTAYKKLALRWHPDRCSSMGNLEFEEEAKKKFQAIQEAYSAFVGGKTVLSDSNKRFLYDVGAYNSDDDEADQNGMGDFLSEMAAMMNQSKPNESNNSGDSFEQLQDLFNEMFQGDPTAFPSSSSTFTSSCSFVFDTNGQQSQFGRSDPFGFDSRSHTFSLGVEHQQDFKKGKNNGGGRRNRRKTQSSNNYGVSSTS